MTDRQSTVDTEQRRSGRWMPWVLAAVAVVVLSFELGSRELSSPDETRYAAIAWSMGKTGDWLTPTHNVKFKHWHKPPLTYWLMASSFAVLGQNEWAARLPSACAALAAVLGVYVIGRTLRGPRTGLLSGLILLGSPLFFALARLANTDMLLCAFVTWTWVCFVRSVFGSKRGRAWFVLGGVFAGLGFMTKGPVVLVATLVPMLLTMLVTNRRWRVGWWPWLAAAGAFLVVGLPWYIIVCVKNPGLLRYFVEYQTLMRVTTEVHGRAASFWFFFWVVPLGAFPWCVFVPFVVLTAIRRRRTPGGWGPLTLVPVLWFVVVFAVITASKSNLATYCLPLFPAIALGVGAFIDRSVEAFEGRGGLGSPISGAALVVFLISLAAGIVGPASLAGVEISEVSRAAAIAAVIVAAAGAAAFVASCFRRERLGVALLLCGVLAMLLSVTRLTTGCEDKVGIGNASNELAALIEAREAPPAEGVQIRVAMFRRYLKALPYYLDQAVMCLDCDIERSYTTADGEEVSLYTIEEQYALHEGYARRHGLMWLNRWMRQSDRRWFVVTDRRSFEEIRPTLVTSTGVPLVVKIAEVGELVLFSNFRDGDAVKVMTAAGREAEQGDGGE
jgi:4-amino-4-deoxy-L-arabinose transferase-like glycosyltransferase